MDEQQKRLDRCLTALRRRTDFLPAAALVLGSGLGGFADRLEIAAAVRYDELGEDFPVSTVSGHAGRFVFGRLNGLPMVVMQGRVHYYEGYEMADVALPIRLMRRLGAQTLTLTNAAGGVNPAFRPGDLMLITDHIAGFVPPVLRGPNDDTLGPRFPDMSHVYSPRLCALLRAAAAETGVSLREGVYLQLPGPSYETPAEIRMAAALDADAVGMSTACEAVAAVHAGFTVCGLSCISNLAAGLSPTPLSHAEVKAAADEAGPRFSALLEAFFGRLAHD